MTKLARAIVKFLATLCLLWLGAMISATACSVLGPFLRNREALAGITAFVAGLVLFHFHRFNIVYVFGHEMTHWLVAKFFLRDTGKIRLSASKGSVEIMDTNVWITLAPYVIPFYVLVAIGIFGLTQLFRYPSPWWAGLAFNCLAGLAFAYHATMTVFVLRKSQSDLNLYGPGFSLALILVGNAAVALLTILMTTRLWTSAWRFFQSLALYQWNCFHCLLQHIPFLR